MWNALCKALWNCFEYWWNLLYIRISKLIDRQKKKYKQRESFKSNVYVCTSVVLTRLNGIEGRGIYLAYRLAKKYKINFTYFARCLSAMKNVGLSRDRVHPLLAERGTCRCICKRERERGKERGIERGGSGKIVVTPSARQGLVTRKQRTHSYSTKAVHQASIM